MDPFDNNRKRRRRDPFDFFGFDDDFERMFRYMEKMWEHAFRDTDFNRLEPGKSFVHGFNVRIGPNGMPRIEEFGNSPKKIEKGKTVISEERQPITDIIEVDEDISITIEIPGVEKQDIKLNINDSSLEIDVDSPNRKYHKLIDLPCSVVPDKAKATYNNGVLDITVKRKEKKRDNEGYHVTIE